MTNSWLALEGEGLAVGQTKRIKCPHCLSTTETYSIRKSESGEVTGYCYRASCHKFDNAQGTITYEAGTSFFKPRKMMHRTTENPDMALWLERNYAIPPEQVALERIKYAPDVNRIVMPVYDKDGVEYGHCTKAVKDPGDYPKVINYFLNERIKLHYPRSNLTNPMCVVLVEDILSSIRVAQITDSVALLGTTLNDAQVYELKNMYDKAIIALDPDATQLAYKMQSRYNGCFTDGIHVAPIRHDPKDYAHNEGLKKDLGL